MIGVRQLRITVSFPYCVQKMPLTFNPTPPAFRLTINTFGSSEAPLNADIASFRFFTSIVPSNLYHLIRSRSSTSWMRSRKVVNWEKTTARKQGSWSRRRPVTAYDQYKRIGSGEQDRKSMGRTEVLQQRFQFGGRAEVIPAQCHG